MPKYSPLIDPVHLIYAFDMCNTARSFAHESNTCVIDRLAFLNLGSIDILSCTPLPVTLNSLASQNSGLSTNLKIFDIALREVGSWAFPRNCAGVRHWVILVAPRRVRKINHSIEVRTSEVKVSTIGLSHWTNWVVRTRLTT